jgi:hypothetical protein
VETANGKPHDRSKKLVAAINIAIANCQLYSREHALIEESGAKTFSVLSELMPGPVEMMVIDDDLVVNKVPMRDGGMQAGNLARRFTRKGISRVDFLDGITPEEFSQFIIDLSQAERAASMYPHIKAGLIDVSIGRSKKEGSLTVENLPQFREEQIERLKAVYENLTASSSST